MARSFTRDQVMLKVKKGDRASGPPARRPDGGDFSVGRPRLAGGGALARGYSRGRENSREAKTLAQGPVIQKRETCGRRTWGRRPPGRGETSRNARPSDGAKLDRAIGTADENVAARTSTGARALAAQELGGRTVPYAQLRGRRTSTGADLARRPSSRTRARGGLAGPAARLEKAGPVVRHLQRGDLTGRSDVVTQDGAWARGGSRARTLNGGREGRRARRNGRGPTPTWKVGWLDAEPRGGIGRGRHSSQRRDSRRSLFRASRGGSRRRRRRGRLLGTADACARPR